MKPRKRGTSTARGEGGRESGKPHNKRLRYISDLETSPNTCRRDCRPSPHRGLQAAVHRKTTEIQSARVRGCVRKWLRLEWCVTVLILFVRD